MDPVSPPPKQRLSNLQTGSANAAAIHSIRIFIFVDVLAAVPVVVVGNGDRVGFFFGGGGLCCCCCC